MAALRVQPQRGLSPAVAVPSEYALQVVARNREHSAATTSVRRVRILFLLLRGGAGGPGSTPVLRFCEAVKAKIFVKKYVFKIAFQLCHQNWSQKIPGNTVSVNTLGRWEGFRCLGQAEVQMACGFSGPSGSMRREVPQPVIRDCESFEELAACTEDLSCLSMRTLEAAMWKLVRLPRKGGSTTGGKMRELAERLLETAFFPPDSMPEDASSERPRHWIIKAALVCSTRMSVKPRKGLFDEMCRQFVEQMDMFEHKDLVQFKEALHDWKQEGQPVILPTHVYDEFLRALNGLPPPHKDTNISLRVSARFDDGQVDRLVRVHDHRQAEPTRVGDSQDDDQTKGAADLRLSLGRERTSPRWAEEQRDDRREPSSCVTKPVTNATRAICFTADSLLARGTGLAAARPCHCAARGPPSQTSARRPRLRRRRLPPVLGAIARSTAGTPGQRTLRRAVVPRPAAGTTRGAPAPRVPCAARFRNP